MESRIDYWFDGKDILSVDTTKPPEVGEVIHIDTMMDKLWYDNNFSNDRLYREGVRGYFKVEEVRRYYKAYDIKVEEKLDSATYVLPSQKIIETFEVELQLVEKF